MRLELSAAQEVFYEMAQGVLESATVHYGLVNVIELLSLRVCAYILMGSCLKSLLYLNLPLIVFDTLKL